jgi:hypothetical protein
MLVLVVGGRTEAQEDNDIERLVARPWREYEVLLAE